MNQEIITLDEFQRTLNLWWLVALVTIFGGVAGFAFRYIAPPAYESKATFHVAVDFTNTVLNKPEMAPARIYDEDQSMQTVQVAFLEAIPQVVAYAKSLGTPLDDNSFGQNSSIERMLALWDIRFRDKDPVIAQKIVNQWAILSLNNLDQKKLSGALKPYLSYELVNKASLPIKPSYFQTNILVLAGCIIGLVIGIALTNFPGVKSGFKAH
jgi:uncharacterized protein involved in exopolysaccharide biosynthesis